MAFEGNPFTDPLFFLVWFIPPLILQIIFDHYYKKENGFTKKNVIYLVLSLIWLLVPVFIVFVVIMVLAFK